MAIQTESDRATGTKENPNKNTQQSTALALTSGIVKVFNARSDAIKTMLTQIQRDNGNNEAMITEVNRDMIMFFKDAKDYGPQIPEYARYGINRTAVELNARLKEATKIINRSLDSVKVVDVGKTHELFIKSAREYDKPTMESALVVMHQQIIDFYNQQFNIPSETFTPHWEKFVREQSELASIAYNLRRDTEEKVATLPEEVNLIKQGS